MKRLLSSGRGLARRPRHGIRSDRPRLVFGRLAAPASAPREASRPAASASIARRVMAARAQQLVARRDFDQNRDVPAGRDRHPHERHAQPENLVELVVEAEPFVLARRVPSFELHDELDALRRPRRGDAEQILDVDQAEPAQLHVMPRQLRDTCRSRIVSARRRISTVSSATSRWPRTIEVERAFALADAALPDDQHAEAEDVQQHGVQDRALGERVLEDGRELGDRRRRHDRRLQQRQPGAARLRSTISARRRRSRR